jgi:hypothetical protein
MTEDDFRRIIREEFDRVAKQHEAEARAPWSPPPPDPKAEAPLAWVASAPLGTTGTAKDLLPVFLASDVAPPGVAWTPVSFGMALSRIRDRITHGRCLTRELTRKGLSVFTVRAFPRK